VQYIQAAHGRRAQIAQEIEVHLLQTLQGGLAVQERFDLVMGLLRKTALDLAADDGFVVNDSDPEALHSLSPQRSCDRPAAERWKSKRPGQVGC
jgi:hypothetical protein